MNRSPSALRIMHVVVTDAFAGVERYVSRLAAGQAAAGHQVVVMGGRTPAMSTAIAAMGATVAVTPAGPMVRAARRIRTLGRRADVIHVHMTAAEIAAGLAALTTSHRSAAVVSTRHFGRPRGHGPQGRVVASMARRTLDAEIAISRFVQGEIDGNATVVYPGVDDRPDGRPAADRERVVLLVQRMEREKRTDFALRTFAGSGLATQGWRLRVAGDGSLRDQVRLLAHDLGIGDVTEFLGTRDDVDELMTTAGVLLAPCDVEALGLSVLEAMAGGLPVVAAAAGGHLELLDSLDPRALHPSNDHAAAARALSDLAGDVQGRDRYGAAAQARQRTRFTLTAQVAGTDRVYRSVL